MTTQLTAEHAEFVDHYLVALAFTAMTETEAGIGDGPECWSNPGGDIRDVVSADDVRAVLSADDLAEIESDCVSFYDDNRSDIGDRIERAAHDFHFTRNGHGAGFWDGDWEDEIGRRLTAASKAYGSCELMVTEDDDGEIVSVYLSH